MFCLNSDYPKRGAQLYDILCGQLSALCEGERHAVPELANAAALLAGALEHINWVGFYTAQEDGLLLGPFQGRPACIHIPYGRGVCGTAAARDEAQRVDDVHLFPGHIACDPASCSELVIPLHCNGRVAAVLDIDSPETARFDEDDLAGLTRFCRVLERAIDWPEVCERFGETGGIG